MKSTFALFIALVSAFYSYSQTSKKTLTHAEILKWERITETVISNDGNIVVYKQEPWKGDATIKITTPSGEEKAAFTCATGAKISFDSKVVVFTLKAPEDSIRNLKLKKAKKEDFPADQLCVHYLSTGKTDTIKKIISSKLPEKWAGWIAWQTEVPKDTSKTKTKTEAKKEDEKVYPLFVKNLNTGVIIEFPAVSNYLFAEEKEALVFISDGKDSTFEAGIYVLNLPENLTRKIFDGKRKVKQLTINKNGDAVAFLTDTSNVKKEGNNFDLCLWNGGETATMLVQAKNSAFPENWVISENGTISFSENGKRLFFGTAPVKAAKDSTIPEDEIPMLDIWRWNEDVLQTAQLVNRDKDLKKTWMAVYHTDDNKVTQLETTQFTGIRMIAKGDGAQILVWSNKPYAVQSMWEGEPDHHDFYLVDMQNGTARMFKKDVRAVPQVSPESNFIYWYNPSDTAWYTYEIATSTEYRITTAETVQCADELNDTPNLPGSYRMAGWLKNDEALLIYDRFDIWKVNPRNLSKPQNITQTGRKESTSYRVVRFDDELAQARQNRGNETAIDTKKPLFLMGNNETTRGDGFYLLDCNKPGITQTLLAGNFKLNRPKKAEDADVVVFSKEDFQTYPDLLATNISFKKLTQLSHVAPQQNDFVWGTAELVTWTSLDGRKLEGTLHKPENFDPSKKYPLIVNFYEKSSQELYNYRVPEPGRSTIDYHWYTSNGYLIFNPDIYYKTGYPGEDAFNCVMPGITSLIEKGFVDEKHIGAQGHSWGGYQVAYLATRTNLFAAIESGAPVVNMFSAYGGIRWTTGLNRSFQYEHTQSRIGKSIWEAPLRYLENSPIFTIDKINTPLLIMANDDDGAVPWYQGIEFFIGLRRLQKPAWMLNYNEADHWPTKLRDRHDFQIRMSQFFDHYLKGEPMPKWMKDGIPAIDKGIEMGYEK